MMRPKKGGGADQRGDREMRGVSGLFTRWALLLWCSSSCEHCLLGWHGLYPVSFLSPPRVVQRTPSFDDVVRIRVTRIAYISSDVHGLS